MTALDHLLDAWNRLVAEVAAQGDTIDTAAIIEPAARRVPQVEPRFGREFYAHWSGCQGSAEIAARAALRALADPKPAEPTGLGAVVRDREGATYVRVAVHFDGWAVGEMWRRVGGEVNADKRRAWSDIDVAEVLSEGWSE